MKKVVQYICDSKIEAEDMVAWCERQGYTEVRMSAVKLFRVVMVEGDRESGYRFRTPVYITDEMGQPHVVTAIMP